jgi:hypothetical protein
MKIAIIIDIMKTFTSFSLPVRTADNPAPRIIIPYSWGASPHALGERVGLGRARAEKVGGAFRPTAPRQDQGANRLPYQIETSVKSQFVILSAAKDLAFWRS